MHRRCVILVLLECVLLGAAADVSGVAVEDDIQAKVKAAYLLNFLRFTMWPPESFPDTEGELAPIVIIVLGEDQAGVADLLAAMTRGKTIHDRPITVHRLTFPAADDSSQQEKDLAALFETLASAHLLYIEASLEDKVSDILEHVNEHVLTVSDCTAFPARGGMLGLVLDGTRIVFEANTDAINRSRVRISSKVLRLARAVAAEENE